MAEGFEHYHVPQQSRRDKLRVLEPSPILHPLPSSLYDPSLISSDLLACVNNNQQGHHDVFHSGKAANQGGGGSVKEERSNLMMGFVNSGAGGSSSSSSPPASVSHHGYLDPFLYPPQNLQSFREFDYNDGSGIMVFKPEPLSLSLSSHNKNTHHHALELNLDQRYGAIYGDKVGGGGGGGVVPVVVGGGSGGCASNEVSRNSTVVPVRPFTGYSSVLKGSRFLRPAQQLLEDLCDIGVRGVYSEKITADASLMETPAESLSASGIVVDDSLGDVNEGRKNKSRLLTMLDEVYMSLFSLKFHEIVFQCLISYSFCFLVYNLCDCVTVLDRFCADEKMGVLDQVSFFGFLP